MSHRKIRLALSLLFLAVSANADIISDIKGAKNPDSLYKLLMRAGVPSGPLDSLGKFYSSAWGFSPKTLKRAESFKADLDGDGRSELITQFFFEFPLDDYQNDFKRVYFILIHKDKVEGTPIDFRLFSLTYCGYAEKGGLKFAFKGSKRKEIVFNLMVSESCGLQISTYEQSDTLRYQSNGFKYLEGSRRNEAFMDRSEIPEPPDP